MKKINLPPGWIAVTTAPQWAKPYGRCSKEKMCIYIYPPKWIPRWFGLRVYFEQVIWNHEALHAWGNQGCSNPFCLGYEGSKLQEYYAFIPQALAWFRFCKKCMSYYPNGSHPSRYMLYLKQLSVPILVLAILIGLALLSTFFRE